MDANSTLILQAEARRRNRTVEPVSDGSVVLLVVTARDRRFERRPVKDAASLNPTVRSGFDRWRRAATESYSVDETVERLTEAIGSVGGKLFAVIDQSAEADSLGLRLRDTRLLIFGKPAAGTPIMEVAPLSALDLPLKILVWTDDGTPLGSPLESLTEGCPRTAVA